MNAVTSNIPMPKRRKTKAKTKVPAPLRKAANEYKEAYKAVYHMEPRLTYDGKWVRIHGQSAGVNTKRLKELTTLLRNRVA